MIKGWTISLLAFSAAIGVTAAHAYRPNFDPRGLKGPRAGTPNQVMVLGTPHLSQMPASFDPIKLRGLLDRLGTWGPQAIAIEAVSGPQCEFLRRYPARYRDTVESYCWDSKPAQSAVGFDVAAASAEIDRMLAVWPATPAPSRRRRLAALFLAAGDQASALVQWLRMAPVDRRPGDGLSKSLADRLEMLRTRRNESLLIAAPLAAQLGHERVYPMDDHSADSVVVDEKAYGDAIMRAWDNPATSRRKAISEALEKDLGTESGVLTMYRTYNAPEMARLVFDSDFGAALEEPSRQRFGRGYVGYWETRNLRMAANIRDVLANSPGTRALVIVGASHKWYLEAYLDQMHDLQLVDAGRVLD